MENTVSLGEALIVEQRYCRKHSPDPGDIIVSKKDDRFYLKRLIAVGGTTITGRDNTVFVGGSALQESYAKHNGLATPELESFGPVHVPAGKLFVMGDNRDVSLDSRTETFGLVSETAVLGKALYIVRSTSETVGRDLR